MDKNIVYFLGAGCSKNFGYPLTGEIMPEILQNLYKKKLFKLNSTKTELEKQHEQELIKFIGFLYPGLTGKNLRVRKQHIPSIIEVLSMVDHLCFYNIPPHPALNEEKLSHFRYLLNRAVAELLMDYDIEYYTDNEKRLLDRFMAPIIREKKRSNVSIITTNYDLSIDEPFEDAIRRNLVDYGIPYRSNDEGGSIMHPPAKPLFRYYKLHGSLNWLKCDLCGQYYIHPDSSVAHQAFREEIDEDNTCVCNNRLKLRTVLVAPSLVRDIRDSNLLQIWKAAIEAIRTADKLIFIGYSLPGEDLAIKSVIMRGLNGRIKSRRLKVEVVQHGIVAKPNYVNLFGKDITYYSKGLKEYLSKNQNREAENGI